MTRFAAVAADEPNARGGIQALDAALTVLRAFAAFDGPASLGEIARATEMQPSKVHRYLASFVHAGLVTQRERTGRYDLGPAAAALGLAAIARNDFVNRAADRLDELSHDTGLTTLLSVWGTEGATVVRWERAASLTITSLGLGSTLPLVTSASGRVFLAFLPRTLLARRLADEMAAARAAGGWPDLPADAQAVDRLAAEVRSAGVAQVDGRFIPGLRAIAAPILNWQGEVEVAVTIIGTADDMLAPASRAQAQLLAFVRALSIP